MLSGQLHSNRGFLIWLSYFFKETPFLHNYTDSTIHVVIIAVTDSNRTRGSSLYMDTLSKSLVILRIWDPHCIARIPQKLKYHPQQVVSSHTYGGGGGIIGILPFLLPRFARLLRGRIPSGLSPLTLRSAFEPSVRSDLRVLILFLRYIKKCTP